MKIDETGKWYFMKKAVIFGAGYVGKTVYEKIKDIYCVLYATDNDERKYGVELVPNVPIRDKTELFNGGFDCVVIASSVGLDEIFYQLREEFNIDESSIIRKYIEFPIVVKKQFIESYSKIVRNKGIKGDVCEVGVFRGEFAKIINETFPDRTCYLFDTFEGFDSRDIAVEQSKGYSNALTGYFYMTSVELVLSKMSYPNKCEIKKGYFPDSFDLFDASFCFVNLDVDLYKPMEAALDLFYPRMSKGGIILIHDYFGENIRGVLAAVDKFTKENDLQLMPIGDGISVAIVKN
jgi:hypothetical protein